MKRESNPIFRQLIDCLPLHLKSTKKREHTNVTDITPDDLPSTSKTTPCNAIPSKYSDDQKYIDIKLSLHTAMHDAKSTKTNFVAEHFKAQRRKCSELILNVISPSFLQDIIDDVGDERYALVIDDFINTTSTRYIVYCIRYFSVEKNKIINDFLGYSVVRNESRFNDIRNFLEHSGLKVENLMAIGGYDSCRQMDLLHLTCKENFPNLLLLPSNCLQFCIAKACEKLPLSLETFLRESRNWFSCCSIRQMKYNKIYESINVGKEPSGISKFFPRPWLAWSEAVSTTLTQWRELQLHFVEIINDSRSEKCLITQMLADMYQDDTNLLYLTFLNPILMELSHLNQSISDINGDLLRYYTELQRFLLDITKRFIKPSFFHRNDSFSLTPWNQSDVENMKIALESVNNTTGCLYLPLKDVDFGENFENTVLQRKMAQQKIFQVRTSALSFLVQLSKELISNFSTNLTILEKCRTLSPDIILTDKPNEILNEIPWHLVGEDGSKESTKHQLRLLKMLKVYEKNDCFKNVDRSSDLLSFWMAVRDIKNDRGERIFADLTKLAIALLTLPVHNPITEMVYCAVRIIEIKKWNKPNLDILFAIIRIRIHLKVLDKCCYNFKPTPRMMNLLNADVYNKIKTQQIEDNLTEALRFLNCNQFEIFCSD